MLISFPLVLGLSIRFLISSSVLVQDKMAATKTVFFYFVDTLNNKFAQN